MSDSPGPLLEIRVRWRAGSWLLLTALLLVPVAWWRPLSADADPRARLATAVVLALGLSLSAFLASLRGHGQAEHRAFLAFLALSLDGLAQAASPWGWPGWPLLALLVGATAVSESFAVSVGIGALAGALGVAEARFAGAPLSAQVAAPIAQITLAIAVNRATRGEQRRLAAARAEIERLRHGLDQLDGLQPGSAPAPLTSTAVSLRHISEEGRRTRQVERVTELDVVMSELTRLARLASHAHSVAYFDVDHKRDSAYLRAFDGPDSLLKDSRVPLGEDPFGFVLQRLQPFYMTDLSARLHALPWYRPSVKIGTLLAVPVMAGESVAGVLVADRLEIQGFGSGEPEVLQGFASFAGRALQQAREALSREELGAEFRAVYGVSSNLTRLEDDSAVHRVLLRSARDLVPQLEAAAFVTADDALTRYLVGSEALGWPKDFGGREVGLTERTWAAWMLRGVEEPHLLESISEAEESMPILVLDEGGGRAESLLALPMRERGRMRSTLLLMGKSGTFSAGANRVLGILANQAAGVLSTIRLMERNKQLAIRDGLTGLYNRRAFEEALARAIANASRDGDGFAVMLLDVDHFKKLNDTYGHPAGDAALKHVAKLVSSRLREGDLAARYGGEEFVAILPRADEDAAVHVADRAREALASSSLVSEGAKIRLSASFGVAVFPSAGKDREQLLGAADRALYAAKDAGRNRVVRASTLPEAQQPDQSAR